MTRLQAHALLNAAKRGEPVPYEAITEALRATGDIADAQPFVGGFAACGQRSRGRMSSDDKRRPADRAFRQPGVGMTVTFKCPKCGVTRGMLGRRLRMRGGVRTWLCAQCVGAGR